MTSSSNGVGGRGRRSDYWLGRKRSEPNEGLNAAHSSFCCVGLVRGAVATRPRSVGARRFAIYKTIKIGVNGSCRGH